MTKLNITFFMGNKVLNTFSSNNFFEESNVFRENGVKKFWGTRPFFRRWGSSYAKSEYNFFRPKLDAKYFHVKQFFCKNQVFLRNCKKLVLGCIWEVFKATFPFLYIIIFYRSQSLEPLTPLLGGDRHMRPLTFLYEI